MYRYYEWLKKGKERLPHLTKPKEDRLMLLAGLWDCVTLEGTGRLAVRWRYAKTGSDIDATTNRKHRAAMDVYDCDDGRKQGIQLAARPTACHPCGRTCVVCLAGYVVGQVDTRTEQALCAILFCGTSSRMVSASPVLDVGGERPAARR